MKYITQMRWYTERVMNIGRYFPSAPFVVIVSSIVVSAGLVVAAQYFTRTETPARASITVSTTSGVPVGDWLETLQQIEGTNIATSTPENEAQGPAELLAAAESSNVTDTIAHSLFLNLSAAKSQGLGSDVPTQDKIVEQAITQLDLGHGTTTAYSAENLTLANSTSDAIKAYGNAFARIFSLHSRARYNEAILAFGEASRATSTNRLGELEAVQKDYDMLAQELAKIPVPPAFVPFHLQVINNYARIVQSFNDMAAILEDPLRALAGFKTFDALTDETYRVFINIAQELDQNSILFTKDEPGSTWTLLSP
jgi:hypothetical protein